jgi:hypothetical protein
MALRTRHGSALAFAGSLWLGCSPHRPAPEPNPAPAHGQYPNAQTAAPAPPSSATLEGAGASPVARNFTNAAPPRFATVLGDTVVLQIGLQGVRTKGPVELLNVPDDADSSYRARRAVDETMLPDAVRQQRGVEVTLIKPALGSSAQEELTSCNARLGTISAYGWADETQPWRALSKPAIAQKTFKEGTPYLAAELESGACPLRRWAMFSSDANLRFWRVAEVSSEVSAAALRAVSETPESASRQSEYAAFVSRVEKVRSQVEAARANDPKTRERLAWYKPSPLPDHWLSLHGRTAVWMVENASDPALLVGLFERHVADVAPDKAGSGSGDETYLFESTLLVVWRYGGGIESVVGTLVSSSPEELSGFKLRGAVSNPGGWPALLFNALYVNGVLRPVDGKYAVDESLMLRPAKPKKPGAKRADE